MKPDRCVSPGCERPAIDAGRCDQHARDLRVARCSATVPLFDERGCNCSATFRDPQCKLHGAQDYHGVPADAPRPLLEQLAQFGELVERARGGSFVAWDQLAEHLGYNVDEPGDVPRAREALGFPRPVGPRRKASDRCESGRRNYCTCDTCW